MRVWATAGATTLFVGVLLASCREPTEVTLELTTDLPCAALGDTSIYVGTAQELAGPLSGLTAAAVTHGCLDGKEGRIGSIVVLPSGGDDDRFSLRVVAGRNNAKCTSDLRSGCIEARRSLGFVPHTPLFLPLELSKTCENVVCDSATDTCVAGKCVPSAVDCSKGCTTPGIDAGLLDATSLLDVDTKDVLPKIDTGLDAPTLLDGGPPDANLSCLAPAPDAGVSKYTWHFDEGVGTVTSEANKLLPDATLPNGVIFVPGAGLGCKTALSPGGIDVTLGSSVTLAAPAFRVDFWIQTTKANTSILTLQDLNSQAKAWGVGILNGSLFGAVCSNLCVTLPNPTLVNDGVWHSVTFARTNGGTAALSVDGAAPVVAALSLKPATTGQLLLSFSGAVDELHFGP